MPISSFGGDSHVDPPIESIIGRNNNSSNNPYPRISKNIPEEVKVIETN